MDVTAKLDAYDVDKIRLAVRDELQIFREALLAELSLKKTTPAKAKADKLEERIQEAITSAKEQPRPEITDDDLPENMRPNTREGFPPPEKDRPITPEDKTALVARFRTLSVSGEVFKTWVLKKTGATDPWTLGFYHLDSIIALFEKQRASFDQDAWNKFLVDF